MRTAIAFGTFDLLHPGHAHYLREARQHAGRLVVVVALDETVREVKGKAPREDERTRLAAVAALPYVDEALLGERGDKYAVLARVRPDVICLGYDQAAFIDGIEAALARLGLHAQVVRIGSHEPEKYKSSKMRKD